MNGDKIVALIGIVMALMIVSNGSRFRNISPRQRLIYGAIWAVILGVGAVIAERLTSTVAP